MSDPIRLSPKKLIIEHESKSSQGRGRFYLRAPADHAIEQVQDPSYFGHYADGKNALREFDQIEVESEDRSWEMTLTVLSISPQTRRVVTRLKGEVIRYEAPISKAHSDAGYALRYISRDAGWGIFINGNDLVEQGFKTQTRAAERLEEITPDKTKKAA